MSWWPRDLMRRAYNASPDLGIGAALGYANPAEVAAHEQQGEMRTQVMPQDYVDPNHIPVPPPPPLTPPPVGSWRDTMITPPPPFESGMHMIGGHEEAMAPPPAPPAPDMGGHEFHQEMPPIQMARPGAPALGAEAPGLLGRAAGAIGAIPGAVGRGLYGAGSAIYNNSPDLGVGSAVEGLRRAGEGFGQGFAGEVAGGAGARLGRHIVENGDTLGRIIRSIPAPVRNRAAGRLGSAITTSLSVPGPGAPPEVPQQKKNLPNYNSAIAGGAGAIGGAGLGGYGGSKLGEYIGSKFGKHGSSIGRILGGLAGAGLGGLAGHYGGKYLADRSNGYREGGYVTYKRHKPNKTLYNRRIT